jgi:hypothetical protein
VYAVDQRSGGASACLSVYNTSHGNKVSVAVDALKGCKEQEYEKSKSIKVGCSFFPPFSEH